MKDSELNEFFDAMSDVKPLAQTNNKHQLSANFQLSEQQKARREAAEKAEEKDNNYLSLEAVELVAPLDMLSYKKPGVQEGVHKKLRLGKYPIEQSLDLKHSTTKQARELVFNFIQQALQKNNRSLLIKHGIGLHSKPHPALLKSYVNKWLQDIPQVLAFHSALKPHGGNGALYILIKKSEESKLQNRELHAKR